MTRRQKEQLLNYLLSFATENKRDLIEKRLQDRTRHITVVMEDIYQSQNASAVLRTSDCFGIQDVHVIENRNSYEINPKVVHGASKWIDIHRYSRKKDNTSECLEYLRSEGYRIIATSPHSQSVSLHELEISQPFALLFGTERRGLYTKEISLADE